MPSLALWDAIRGIAPGLPAQPTSDGAKVAS
jgi:hypothetical protein